MMSKQASIGMAAMAGIALLAATVQAGGYKLSDPETGNYLKIGGRVQLQYHHEDPDGGDATDELFFRRLRPYIECSMHEDWKAKVQWDFGKSKTEIKEAIVQYSGIEDVKLTLGNKTFPYSLEARTSSKKQALVERTFVGDHNYGTPDYTLGLYADAAMADKMVMLGAGVGMGAVDPSNKKLDFDSAASLHKGDDWSEGPIAGLGLDIYPMGYFKPCQGDFKGDPKVMFGVAGFHWANDDDNLTPENSNDVDTVTGIEGHLSLRGFGASLDAEYNLAKSELKQSDITDGLYENSETKLKNWAVEAGYMIVPATLEIVAGYQSQDADNYDKEWTRTSVGINYYIDGNDIKIQGTYRSGKNKDGKDGSDVDEVFVQTQYVF